MSGWKYARPFRLLLIAALLTVGIASTAQAQATAPQTVSGRFGVGYAGYDGIPLLVGLIDASPYFGEAPVALPPREHQYIGTYRGVASNGTYTLTLPSEPVATPFDVTGGNDPASGVRLFDIRLMSDVAERGYMVTNEDNIASSVRISIAFTIEGGTLLVWAQDDRQQFPTGPGPDGRLFTADDPQMPLPAGWSLVNIDSSPFTLIREPAPTLDLVTTGLGDTIDYAALSCSELIPTFLDRVQQVYPFTDLYGIDWAALRARLIPASQAAATPQDCEKIIRDFGNAIPDGHVNYYLPTLRDEIAGSLGMILTPLTDGQIAVSLLRPGGPAQRAGIEVGAVITTWEGRPVAEALERVVLQSSNASTPHALLARKLTDLTRGPLGSTVAVGFQNPGRAPAAATLTRDRPQPVESGSRPDLRNNRLPSGLGYIRIERFDQMRTLRAFDAAVTSLVEQEAPGIIIDVRANPGGFSQISDAMASRFFETSFLIGNHYSPDGRLVFQMKIDPRPPVYNGPLVVLVDVNTASAGDLFAYTFKATGRALIAGHTPSGGLAGTVSGGQYFLPGGAFIQVPTGALVDADHRIVVEGEGVAPDLLVPLTVESLVSAEDEVLQAAEAALLEPVRP